MPKINLLNILPGDSQTILIDKVNYNFDQILTAGGGPQGSQGIRGATGPIGPQGIQGPTGPQGLRGARWYVQPVAPSSLTVGSYPTPWGEPELGDYWLAGETGANPYGIYVYNDLGGGALGWDYSGVFINTQSAFTAIDDINATSGERVLIHDTQFSHTYGLLLSDYGASGGAPGYNYSNLTQYGLNSERAKLKIATDPSSAIASLLSFGRADQDSVNFADSSYSQGKNPRFLWSSGSGYNLDFLNPGGDFNIRTPGNNFNVTNSANISLSATANTQISGNGVTINRQGTSNVFNNFGSGSYYAEGSVIRYHPNYGLAAGNFIVGDAVTTNGSKGLVISSSSTSSGRSLVFKAAVSTNNSIFGRIVAEAQSSALVSAGISFAIDGSSSSESRIDFATSSSSGLDVTRLRLDRNGNLQFRFGSLAGSNRDASIFIQEAAGTDIGANILIRAGSSQGGSHGGGTLYLSGGTGGSSSGKSGNVVISAGFVPAAGSAMGGSVYIHPPLINKTNVTGVAIGLAETSAVDAALVVKDVSDGIAGGDILQLKKSDDTTFFGFDSNGHLTKGLPYTNSSDISSVLSPDSNNLDYYDEGDWSSTLQIVPRVTQTGWNSSVYKIIKSRYTRIGDTVQVDFVVKIDNLLSSVPAPTNQSDGFIYIKGFPYSADFTNVRLGTPTNSFSSPALPFVNIKGTGLGNAGSGSGGNPIGTIQPYPGTNIPSGWALCDGSSLSINAYRDLYNALGGSSSPYGSSDGFSSTFNLPDLRGYFVRGLDNSRGIDSGRTIGTIQDDDIKAHTHVTNWGRSKRGTGNDPNHTAAAPDGNVFGDPFTKTSNSTGGSETRPKNIALNYIIYVGSAGGSGVSSISDLSGAFVNESSETRLYLYNGIGNISVSNIPSGSGVVSYLHGSFSYFTTSTTKYGG